MVLVAHAGERRVLANLDELGAWNSFLCRPVAPEAVLAVLETGSVVQWSNPMVSPEARTNTRRVLVVDDDPTTVMLLASTGSEREVVATRGEWEAVDRVTEHHLDLVVCSVTLRTRGDTPFYRFLWDARPDIERRFVFIARPDAGPASGSVVERPITRDVLTRLADRFPRA